MEEIKRLSRELVAHGAILDYYQDTMQIPNGNVVKWDFIKHNGAAAVVPVDEKGRLIMVRQYRRAVLRRRRNPQWMRRQGSWRRKPGIRRER